MQQHIPAEVLSRVSRPTTGWVRSRLIPLGYALTGTLAGTLGITTTLWLAVGWNIFGSAAVPAVPAVRHLRAAPPKDPIPIAPISVRK